ncbi:MAG TPA: FAD-dependent monooxygenase [Opitutus sp.]|nr:FAD-dependent monooxygenase [Opitutus sp.]
MTTSRPIEIIGGGLAGLSLGLALRRAGIAVTIIEAGNYPRHRVCGEFITGLRRSTRDQLGLDPFLEGAAHNREVGWFIRGVSARTQRLPAIAFGLSRHTLDTRLANAFVAGGGHLRVNTRSANFDDAPGRIFAIGRRRSTSRWLGLKLHALDLPLERELELHLGDDAYIGLTRIEDNRGNICGLFRRREISEKGKELLLAYLKACRLDSLAERLTHAVLDDASFCAVAAVDFDRRVQPSREVRLGDTLAMIPPFTGHGMAMAFQSAEIALAPLIAYARGDEEWPHTRHAIHTTLRRRFRVRLASAGALHSFLLQPSRQRWLGALNRARLLPLGPIYAALH